ncbi:MAG: hypothetical protein Q8930_07690 [Bacillota bacterium]|nr:hypothetical protein [Bacillota bacterium]
MGKPSIFSSDYDRKMKARKKRRTVIILVLIAAGLVFITRATFLNWLQKNAVKEDGKDKGSSGYVAGKNSTGEVQGSKSPVTDNKDQKDQGNSTGEPAEVSEKAIDISTPDGIKYILIYSEENGNKTIKRVMNQDNSQVFFNISPSGVKVVFLNAAQDMYVADANGTVSDITKKQYTTSSKSVIDKNSYLKRKPEFLWHGTPKFISDNAVAYITQMPWFNSTRYVYKVDLTTLVHARINPIQGQNVSFDVMDPKGLTVNMDGVLKYIVSDGSVVQ